MKLLFLSDFHLGSPLFESNNDVMSLLDRDYDMIFLIGDTIDTWEDNVWDIVNDNRVLIDKLNSIANLIVIKGNHDPDMNILKTIFPEKTVASEFSLSIDGRLCIVVHGDEFDELVYKYSWVAKLLHPIQWICERIFKINLKGYFRELFHSIAAKRDKKYYNDLVMDVEENLVEAYKKDYQCIVIGHTHLPKLIKRDDFIYANCGDWVYNKTYVTYENGKFGLIDLEGRSKWLG
jgi:UDP-2,3-diacylglucosamine pyrophosphatase LpxH